MFTVDATEVYEVDAFPDRKVYASADRAGALRATTCGGEYSERPAAVATEFGPRVYGGIPEADLAVASRVLTEVIARANAAYEQTADRC